MVSLSPSVSVSLCLSLPLSASRYGVRSIRGRNRDTEHWVLKRRARRQPEVRLLDRLSGRRLSLVMVVSIVPFLTLHLGCGLSVSLCLSLSLSASASLCLCLSLPLQDLGREGGFVWMDGSSVEFVDWAPGEPNGARRHDVA